MSFCNETWEFDWQKNDDVCSGHGVCLNNSTICVCDSSWTGKSDGLNLDQRDCHNPMLVLKILWALVGLKYCLLWWTHVKVLSVQRQRHLLRKKTGSFFTSRTAMIVLPGTLLNCPATVLMSVLKIAKFQSIGYDIPVTIAYLTAKWAGWVPGVASQLDMFDGFFEQGNEEDEFSQMIKKRFHRRTIAIASAYLVISTAALIGYLLAHHFLPPASKQLDFAIVCLTILRLIVTVIYFVCQLKIVATLITVIEQKQLNTSLVAGTKSATILENALNRLRVLNLKTRKGCIVVTTLAVLFCIPHMLQYLDFYFVFTIFIGARKSHFIHAYAVENHSKVNPRASRPSGSQGQKPKLTSMNKTMSDTNNK